MREKKDIKREFLPFGFSELDAAARHFEQKVREGWMIKELGTTCVYEKCRPRELRFNAALCLDSLSDRGNAAEHAGEFIALCEDAGWEHVDSFGQIHLFRTEDAAIPDIETDGYLQVSAVRKGGRENRMLLTLPLGLFVFNAIAHLFSFIRSGAEDVLRLALLIFCLLGACVALGAFLADKKLEKNWCEKALSRLNSGEPMPPSDESALKARRNIAVLGLASVVMFTLGLIAVALIKGNAPTRAMVLSAVICALPLILAINALGRKKRSRRATVIWAIVIALGFVVLFVLVFAAFASAFHVFEELA